MNKTMNNQKGFSLIELMIVVAIIGILSAIAIPNYQRFQQKARQSEAKALLTGLYTSEKTFMAEYGQYFADFRNIGFAPEGRLTYNVGFSAAGAVTAPTTYAGASGVAAGAAPAVYTTLGAAGTGFCSTTGTCTAGATAVADATAMANCGNVATVTAGAFVAASAADLDGDAGIDRWTINQNKALCNNDADI